MSNLKKILEEARSCIHCKAHLPHAPRPILSANVSSRVMIVGQAPGWKVHESGVPWDDASGDRLRDWLGVSREEFYDEELFAIIPMGFCYPGKGKSGDLPPRPECAELWHDKLLQSLPNISLTLLIGQYAQGYYLPGSKKKNLTETVRAWKQYLPKVIPLPHPSPRNNIWLKKNPWFQKELLTDLAKVVAKSFN